MAKQGPLRIAGQAAELATEWNVSTHSLQHGASSWVSLPGPEKLLQLSNPGRPHAAPPAAECLQAQHYKTHVILTIATAFVLVLLVLTKLCGRLQRDLDPDAASQQAAAARQHSQRGIAVHGQLVDLKAIIHCLHVCQLLQDLQHCHAVSNRSAVSCEEYNTACAVTMKT